jgi:hypothetical protein
MTDRDRRVHARFRATGTATILVPNRSVGTFRIENLSAGGALLRGACPLAADALVVVVLELTAGAGFRLAGRIVRIRPDPAGDWVAIEFQRVAPLLEERLRTLAQDLDARGDDAGDPDDA